MQPLGINHWQDLNSKSIVLVTTDIESYWALEPIFQTLPLSQFYLSESILNCVHLQQTARIHAINDQATHEELDAFLSQVKPDLLITGTGLGKTSGHLEIELRRIAKQKNIIQASIVPGWNTLSSRFAGKSETFLTSLPEAIFLINDELKEQAVKEGFPEESLIVTGNPHYDDLVTRVAPQLLIERSQARAKNKLDHDSFVIGLDLNKSPLEEKNKFTSDKKANFKQVIDHFPDSIPNQKFEFVICQTDESSRKFLREIKPDLVFKELDSQTFLTLSQFILGTTSELLTQAVLMGIPTVSLQVGHSNHHYWTQNSKPVPVATQQAELKMILNQIVRKRPWSFHPPYENKNATRSIIAVLATLIVKGKSEVLRSGT